MTLASRVALQKAEGLLLTRLAALQARLEVEPELWPAWCDLVRMAGGCWTGGSGMSSLAPEH